MRGGNIQMIHQSEDVRRHLLDRVHTLTGGGTPAAARIVKNQIERFRQRHLRRLPNLAGISGGGHQNQRLSSTMRFVVEIDASRQFNVWHLTDSFPLPRVCRCQFTNDCFKPCDSWPLHIIEAVPWSRPRQKKLALRTVTVIDSPRVNGKGGTTDA